MNNLPSPPIFRMVVEDVFSIKNYGAAVAGTVQSGFITLHEAVFLTVKNERIRVAVADIEIEPLASHQIALAHRNFQREDIEIGTIVTPEGL